MTAAEWPGCSRLAGLILIATPCVRARSSGYREHRDLANAGLEILLQRCASLHIEGAQFLRVQGLVVEKRQKAAVQQCCGVARVC